MLNIYHSPWRKPQHRVIERAKNIFEPTACRSFQCQNGRPEDCHDGDELALSGLSRAQKIGPGGVAIHQLPCSLFDLVALILEPRDWFSAVLASGASCYQCWPNKVTHWLVWFGASSRTGGAMEKHKFCRWGPDIGAISWLKRIDLIVWHLLVRTANDEEFESSQSKTFPLHLCFFEENETVYLQPHLPCLGDNQFKNDTWRASGPNRPVWSSNSLYSWSGVIVLIGEHENFLLATFWVVTPYFECVNDDQNLTIINFVSRFGQNHFLWVKGYRVLSAQIIQS